MTEMLYRGAGKAKDVQREIVLEAMSLEDRALSVAADCLLAAKEPDARRFFVRLAAKELVKHWPHAVRDALEGR